MLRRLSPRSQAGDTIIEVMLAFAILAFAIGIAYQTANRSLVATRQAQESSQATQIAQSQLEYVRSLSSDFSRIAQSGGYCIRQESGSINVIRSGDTNFATRCQDGIYDIRVFYCATQAAGTPPCDVVGPSAQDTFIARVTWQDVDGSGESSAALSLRMHAP